MKVILSIFIFLFFINSVYASDNNKSIFTKQLIVSTKCLETSNNSKLTNTIETLYKKYSSDKIALEHILKRINEFKSQNSINSKATCALNLLEAKIQLGFLNSVSSKNLEIPSVTFITENYDSKETEYNSKGKISGELYYKDKKLIGVRSYKFSNDNEDYMYEEADYINKGRFYYYLKSKNVIIKFNPLEGVLIYNLSGELQMAITMKEKKVNGYTIYYKNNVQHYYAIYDNGSVKEQGFLNNSTQLPDFDYYNDLLDPIF